MKQLHTLILFFLFTLYAGAQDFRLGRVSIAELEEKSHPSDTSAPAAILYKKGTSTFQLAAERWVLVTEVEVRIKIYKKEGYEYAKQQVGYYTGGANVRVYFDDAYTYNLVGGKIEKTKLRSDGEFEEKINDNFSIKKIVMPNVKEGSVIEYKYVLKTPYFNKLQDWYFQYEIPANDVTYEITVPSCFTFNRYLQGYVNVKQLPQKSRIPLAHKYDETITTYVAKNIKAMKGEEYVNNIRNYVSILKHELASVQFQNQLPEFYSMNWETTAKKIFDNNDFGKQLGLKSYFEDDLKALLVGNLTNDEKMNRIFNYVRDRMNWNSEDGYYTEKGVSKAYKEKVGNVADINLMLTAMLRYAGLNANPVLVSTRENGVALYPSMAAYDYVIASVKNDSGYTLLDATSKFSQPDIIPTRCLNWIGRVIKENGASQEIDLMPKMMSKETINVSVNVDAEGKVSGRIVDQYSEHNALSFREAYNGLSKDSYIERMEKYYKGLQINDYTVTNQKDVTKPVVEDFTFEHTGLVDVIGDKIYLSPMLFYAKETNPFKEEKREYPIDFTYQHQDRYVFMITIPDGYVVESLPKAVSLAMEQNIGSFRYNIASKENQVQLTVLYAINYPTIAEDYYDVIKNFFKAMVEKQSEKIVLKKA